MPQHIEISATIALDQIADSALICAQVAKGFRIKRKSGYPVSVAEREQATNTLLLLFMSFEGYINRIIYLLSDENKLYQNYYNEPDIVKRLEVLIGTKKSSKILTERFKESLALRNSIVHGHLYETRRTMQRKILQKSRLIMHPNQTYKNYVNQNTFRTKSMHLNVIPSEIGVEDVYKMLLLWNKIYINLNNKFGNLAWLSHGYPHVFATLLQATGNSVAFNDLERRTIYSEGLLAIPKCMKNNYL